MLERCIDACGSEVVEGFRTQRSCTVRGTVYGKTAVHRPHQTRVCVFWPKHLPATHDALVPRRLDVGEQILDESGIVLVPGSGFGQEEGTLHFRTTFLPAEETMQQTLKRFSKAHDKFMDEHRD